MCGVHDGQFPIKFGQELQDSFCGALHGLDHEQQLLGKCGHRRPGIIPIYQRHPQANLTAICQRTEATLDGEDHLSFTQGAGHGGSHLHLVHQFVDLLRDKGERYPNAVQSANITLTGILAHESALKNGELIRLPEWSFS